MTGFAHDIAGGQGNLVSASLQSPNFNLANPGASPNPSWALLRSGILYAVGLVLSGGTITGPDYIINTSGIFIYSAAPANGNLIGSWAGVAGTDGFGNAYPQGISIAKGAISGSVFTGTDFVINAAGAFFYSGTPAAGNLVASITTAAGTDSFGNAYKKHITVYGPASTYVEALASTTAQVGLGTGDAAEVTPGLIDTLITGSGTTRSFAMICQSPIASGLTGHLVQLQLYGPSVDGTTFPPQAVLQAADGTSTSALAVEPTGVIATGALTAVTGTAANPTLITTDTWHSLGTLAGYTVNSGRYRLTTWGAYELDINVTSGGANAANTAFSVSLPAGYSGGSSTAYPLTANYAIAAGNSYPRLIVSSAGVVTVAQTASKAGLITGQAFVPAT